MHLGDDIYQNAQRKKGNVHFVGNSCRYHSRGLCWITMEQGGD